jgi:predicted membrane channel-forming protein YqfA (hemolysin III family)
MWHNETLNIWSHLLATLLYILYAIVTITTRSITNAWPLLISEIGNIYLFTISTTFHIMLCVSKKHYKFYRKMDFIAIIIVMYSHYWPFCYYLFESKLFILHVAVGGIFASACVFVNLLSYTNSSSFDSIRPMVFASIALWGAVPITHAAISNRGDESAQRLVLLCVLQILLAGAGALFYIVKWPERRWRIGYISGHFIFHFFIILSFLTFHSGVIIRWNYLYGNRDI